MKELALEMKESALEILGLLVEKDSLGRVNIEPEIMNQKSIPTIINKTKMRNFGEINRVLEQMHLEYLIDYEQGDDPVELKTYVFTLRKEGISFYLSNQKRIIT